MFVRTRTYGPNYSEKQPKAAQTDLKPTQTHPKSASTMPQDMHKLSARTRYQPRIGPVRPKLTQTNPNQPERHHLRMHSGSMHSGSKRADKRSIGRQLQRRGDSRQFTAVHSNSYSSPHDTATHAVAQAAVPVAHTARRFTRCFTRQSIRHRAPAAHTTQRLTRQLTTIHTARRFTWCFMRRPQRLTMVQGDSTARPTR